MKRGLLSYLLMQHSNVVVYAWNEEVTLYGHRAVDFSRVAGEVVFSFWGTCHPSWISGVDG
jgi:hypothetical protein